MTIAADNVTSAITGVYLEAFFRWLSAGTDEAIASTEDVAAIVDLLFEGIAAR